MPNTKFHTLFQVNPRRLASELRRTSKEERLAIICEKNDDGKTVAEGKTVADILISTRQYYGEHKSEKEHIKSLNIFVNIIKELPDSDRLEFLMQKNPFDIKIIKFLVLWPDHLDQAISLLPEEHRQLAFNELQDETNSHMPESIFHATKLPPTPTNSYSPLI